MIEVKTLSKSFGVQKAVHKLSFHVRKGELYGLLGPNGAGKSTTINILSSILDADSGEVIIDNKHLQQNKKKCKQMIGVVPQEIALYDDLSAYENLKFWGSIYNVGKQLLHKRINHLLGRFGLAERKKDAIKTYSGGMKRRINIAAALLHEPEVIFMDEPTVGIDPQSRHHIYEIIEELHQKGITIVYTTHYIEEAERFCQRVGIIDLGMIIAEGSPEDLLNQYSDVERIKVIFREKPGEKASQLKAVFGERLEIKDQTALLKSRHVHTEMLQILAECSKLQLEVSRIDLKAANLEDVFLKLTGRTLRD